MHERTTQSLTPERIAAFIHGELPEGERRKVAMAVAADPVAQAMVLAMQRGAKGGRHRRTCAALLLGLSARYSPTDLDEPLQPASDQPADPVAQRLAAALTQLLTTGEIGDSVGYDLPEVGASARVTLLGEVPTR